MTQREKYFVFGIGFLVGCIVVWMLFFKKEGFDLTPRSQKEVKPWHGRIYYEKIIPIAAAETQATNHFERIRIIDDGTGKKVRLLEVYEKGEQTKNHECILRRQVMASDTIWVHFNSPQSIQAATQWLNEKHAKYQQLNDTLLRLTFPPEEGHDAVKEMIEACRSHSEWINYAFPEYILHYG